MSWTKKVSHPSEVVKKGDELECVVLSVDTDKKRIALGLQLIPLALQRELTLGRLIELKMELLIQCVPAFLVAIHWSRLAAGPTLLGLVLGTLFGVGLTLAGVPRLGGVHVGVVGLLLNLFVAVVGSRVLRRDDEQLSPGLAELEAGSG